MKYNNELSVINTQEKAYLLGQIYGDGCNQCKKNFYKFTMASINTDLELYRKLQEIFPFLKLKFYSAHSNMVYLENYQKSICLDLQRLGMDSPKTLKDITGEFHFPDLREDLVPHFIRGYFDADGSAWFPTRKRSRNNLHIEFSGSTKNFLLKIKEILDINGINFNWYERYKKAGNGNYYYSYTLISSNKDTSLKFADFIYHDATLYLPYKYEICYKTPSYRPLNVDLFGKCPYCNSDNIIKRGTRDNKQRLKCNNCNKAFTRPLPK